MNNKHINFRQYLNNNKRNNTLVNNKILSQQIGIEYAKNTFLDMQNPKNQNFIFSWSHYIDTFIEQSSNNINNYFKSTPKNIKELKKICEQSCKIEWQELIVSALILPVKDWTTDEKIFNISYYVTDHLLRMKEIEYYQSLSKKEQKSSGGQGWYKGFFKNHSSSYFKEHAYRKLNELLNEKCHIDEQQVIKNAVSKNIVKFFNL